MPVCDVQAEVNATATVTRFC